jgi:hypothetical protein
MSGFLSPYKTVSTMDVQFYEAAYKLIRNPREMPGTPRRHETATYSSCRRRRGCVCGEELGPFANVDVGQVGRRTSRHQQNAEQKKKKKKEKTKNMVHPR